MRTPDASYVSSVLAAAESPCVSIYLPAPPSYPDSQHEGGRFRNLVRRAEEALTRTHPGAAGRELADRLRRLEDDRDFWVGAAKGGVAVLASPSRFDAFALPRTVPERVEVGESFHVKPLIRYFQSADPFHVLCLARDRVALFEGNRDELHPLHAPGVPLTFSEELGTTSGGQPSTPATAQPESTTRPHSREGGKESHGRLAPDSVAVRKASDPEVERFFRAVDREVVARVSEPSGRHLILAGIDDNLSEFRRLTKNRFALGEAVHGDWTKWSLHEIREKAWKVFEKQYLAQLAAIREDYGTAAARGQATDDLALAARAAVEGRIGILLVDTDRTRPGAIDMTSGELRSQTGGDTAAGDMLDDLAEMALKIKVRVIVTPPANMPTDTGLAAIYRY